MQLNQSLATTPLIADSLGYITRDIRRLLNDDEGMAKIGEVLSQFARRGLVDCLRAVVASESELAALAAVSYLHGNGFFKIPLARHPSHSLRLHIWPEGVRAEENLHSHRWPFASTVLVGTLTSEIWEDAPGDDALIRPEMIYRSTTEPLEPLGDCRVRLKTVCRYQAGDRYWLPADVLHRIVKVGSGMVMTLTAHPSNTRSWARNVLLLDVTPDATPEYLSVDALRSVLREAAESISISVLTDAGQ